MLIWLWLLLVEKEITKNVTTLTIFLLGKICNEDVAQAAGIAHGDVDKAVSDYIYIQNILHPMKVMKESSV